MAPPPMEISPMTPTQPPPPGVTSNFANPKSIGYEAYIVTSIALTLMIPVVILRIYARAFVIRKVGWDDYTCVIGALSTIAFCGVILALPQWGYGTHQWDIRLVDFGKLRFQFLLVQQELYGPACFFIKLSILLLYLRIFSPNKGMRMFIYAGIGAIFIINAVVTILFPIFCAPRRGENWITSYVGPRCLNHVVKNFLASVVINFVMDLYILVLPLRMVWHLHLPAQKRLGLLAIFAIGILACGASLGALIYRSVFGFNRDYTYYSLRNLFMSIIEMNVGIICSCLPACATLFHRNTDTNRETSNRDRDRSSAFKRSPTTALTSFRSWFMSRVASLTLSGGSGSGGLSKGSKGGGVSKRRSRGEEGEAEDSTSMSSIIARKTQTPSLPDEEVR